VTTNSIAFLALVAALTAGGCSATTTTDKAGGAQTTTVFRLATVDGPDEPSLSAVRSFAARVAALSHGRLEVRLVFDVGSSRADDEQQVVRGVRDDRYQLGWIRSGGWDELGVKSFQALQVPFLITSHALAEAVAAGSVARTMLAGARRAGVVGLALVPGPLRHPATKNKPLRAPLDFAGVRLQVERSRAVDAVLHALGAVPVHSAALVIRHDGELASFEQPGVGVRWMTGDVVFDPGFKTLFANPGALRQLDRGQLAALREAARALVDESARRTPSEQRAAIDACHRSGITIVTASRSDLAALRGAARPVTAALRRDATTKRLIHQMAELKATEPAQPPLAVPKTCSTPSPRVKQATPRPPSLLNGTYHVLFTRADALAFGEPPSDPHSLATLPAVDTRILDNGNWYAPNSDPHDAPGGVFATYTIVGNRLIVSTPQFGSVQTFTFTRDAHGTLYLTPVLPMERGDQWVEAGEPWHRIGPPIRLR
jgi:TRAP-type C4-dicarboxylate transport system substrate-binding protein